jgi:hypothetical protein
MGRAFEYGITISLSKSLSASIVKNTQFTKAEQCFNDCPENEQKNIFIASNKAVAFLIEHDALLSKSEFSLLIQSDQKGKFGDVRDVIIHNNTMNVDIGISAKNRHWAVKHSRLSEHINFGKDWFGISCSKVYFSQITPLFEELHARKKNGEEWKNIPDKIQRYYIPVLNAFRSEMATLSQNYPGEVAKLLVKYLLGKYDFYKVIKENGEVSLFSFNTNGSLKWGNKLPLPSKIVDISQKPGSDTTLVIIFDHGWQISFRIHNASTLVEPSLKFDINIVGLPGNISKNEIMYR